MTLDPRPYDEADPLAAYRDRFVGADTPLVYFDGNSLGRPLRATADRLADFVRDEWGGRLIRGWDERWYDLPLTLGDEIGRVCLGAAARPDLRRRLDDRAALQADPGRASTRRSRATATATRSSSTPTTSRPTATSSRGSPPSAG